MSTTHYDRLHKAIWELHKRNPGRSGPLSLKDSWQTYVVNKRAYLSQVPGVWDDLLNKYWNGYTREYAYAPNKPTSALSPTNVKPPGSYLDRKTQDVVEKAKVLAVDAAKPATDAAVRRLREAAQEESRRAADLLQQRGEELITDAQGTGMGMIAVVAAVGIGLILFAQRKAV